MYVLGVEEDVLLRKGFVASEELGGVGLDMM